MDEKEKEETKQEVSEEVKEMAKSENDDDSNDRGKTTEEKFDPIREAEKAAEELRKQNEERKKILEREEKLFERKRVMQELGGRSYAGQQEQREETPEEYTKRIEREIREGKIK